MNFSNDRTMHELMDVWTDRPNILNVDKFCNYVTFSL